MDNQRKRDTREKIQLGGLVVKAGLRNIDKTVLLGLLVDGAERLADRVERDRLRTIGKTAFNAVDDDEANVVSDTADPSDDDRPLRPSRL